MGCAPEPVTNAQFTASLGARLFRPTLLPFPAAAVKLLFGQMGEEMLLGGQKAVPSKLTKSGFSFAHPSIDNASQPRWSNLNMPVAFGPAMIWRQPIARARRRQLLTAYSRCKRVGHHTHHHTS